MKLVVVAVLLFCGLGCEASREHQYEVGTAHRGGARPAREGLPLAAPWEVELIKRVTWDRERQGFDPALPGYHLAGDIGMIRLKPVDPKSIPPFHRLPAEVVFRIRTSPGMPANVENLTIVGGGFSLSTFLPRDGAETPEIEVRSLSDPPGTAPQRVGQADYLKLTAVGDAVELRLLPAAINLLSDGGQISWVDWFRG